MYTFYSDIWNTTISGLYPYKTFKETKDGFEVKIDLPGIPKEDISLEGKSDSINIIVKDKPTHTINFYTPINSDKVKAKLDLGVLYLTVPHKTQTKIIKLE